jgi:hypothetical protein
LALIPLDNHVLPYIRQELAKPHPLAEEMSLLPWDQGALWAFVPTGNSREERLEWRNACLDFVAAYLHAGGIRTVIMSNSYLKHAGSRALQRPRLGREWTDWRPCGDYLCFYVNQTADVDQIIRLFDDVQASATFGVLVRDVAVLSHDKLPRNSIHALVSRADYALFEIDAYDNSAVLIWSRAGAIGGEAQ